ncbi:MAG: hypothetical protein FVQ79_03275 [Planctomycetes bacterium]|nr:hypothetical protein [Planctomycetota bacterium]
MIERKTVLVLGAGASCPFDFPIGKELVKIIIQNLEPNILLYNILVDHGFGKGNIRDFSNALLGAQPASIDAFLEHRLDFEKIGKEAIAGSLLPFECWSQFNSMLLAGKNNWYRYLFSRLNTSFETFGDNNLSVITFNYDRSFEHYLFTVLKNTYKKTDEECAEKMKSIPVVHLHGSLGKLDWQDSPLSLVHYEAWTDSENRGLAVKRGGENIIIVHEANKETDEFKKAHELLSQADCVYFLGFGFNKDNVERLKIKTLLNKSLSRGTAQGTAHGLPLQERRYIYDLQMAGNQRWNVEQGLTNGFFDLKCYDFLEKQIILE